MNSKYSRHWVTERKPVGSNSVQCSPPFGSSVNTEAMAFSFVSFCSQNREATWLKAEQTDATFSVNCKRKLKLENIWKGVWGNWDAGCRVFQHSEYSGIRTMELGTERDDFVGFSHFWGKGDPSSAQSFSIVPEHPAKTWYKSQCSGFHSTWPHPCKPCSYSRLSTGGACTCSSGSSFPRLFCRSLA